MNETELPPLKVFRFTVAFWFADWEPEEFIEIAEVRRHIEMAPDYASECPDTPLRQIELVVFFDDGGSEAIRHNDKRRVLNWLERFDLRA